MINYIENHTDSQKSFRTIFSFIVKKGKVTRREIQKGTNYSWSSVSGVVSVLLNNNLVIETDPVISGVGRGTSYIVPNGDRFVSIGIDINSTGFTSSVVGVDGSTKYKNMRPYLGNTKKYVLDLMFELIDDCLAFAKDKYNVASIGVSCQGTVINHSIYKRFVFAKDFMYCNIKEIIEKKYGIFTYLEHDTNCLLEDYLFNHNEGYVSVCVARIVSGLGFAISSNGQSLEMFGPIDFGHMIVQPRDGDKCLCGMNGCLEAYVSSVGIARRAGVEDFSIIEKNRDKYRNILDEAGFYLGVALANLSHIFSLDGVVMTGHVIGNDKTMLKQIIKYNNEFSGEKRAEIKYLPDLSASFGAARLSFIEKVDKEGAF